MTKLVGILNITPDSFSDGGKFLKPEHALEQFHTLTDAGADMIDIGAQSTRPDAEIIGPEVEWQRLEQILQIIALSDPDIAISIDTFHGSVAQKALETGIVTCINDVSGGEDHTLLQTVKDYECDYIFMHHLGIPSDKQVILPLDSSPTEALLKWAQKKIAQLTDFGIHKENLIFDIGIGFGKNTAQTVEILKELQRFKALDVPLYVGHSEKSFLASYTKKNAGERLAATLSVSAHAMLQGADYIRVHDVESHHTMRQILHELHP